MSFFLVAVPKNEDNGGAGGSENSAFNDVKRCVKGAAKTATVEAFADVALRVGTLDSLMSLSDELGKVDMFVESAAKKIQRAYDELKEKMGFDDELMVQGDSPKDYVTQFAWKLDRFSPNHPLPELVKSMQFKMDGIDTNMKKLYAEYADAKSKLGSLQRKSAGNLLVADLNDMLTADKLGDRQIADVFAQSEFLKTVAVVVPSKEKDSFLESYTQLDDKAVMLKKSTAVVTPNGNQGQGSMQFTVITPQIDEGGQVCDGRVLPVTVSFSGSTPTVLDLKLAVEQQHEIKWQHQQIEWDGDLATNEMSIGTAQIPAGSELQLSLEMPQVVQEVENYFSPVVPGSAEWLCDDKDGYSLFSVKLLSPPGRNDSYLDGFKKACNERRYTVRMWEPPTETKEGGETLNDQLERTQAKYNKLSASLKRYSKPWYEELMIAWIHLKVIRVFVESVLNFGVPANFQTALIDCTAKDHQKVLAALDEQYANLDAVGVGELSKAGADDAAVQALGGNAEYHPYVYLPIKLGD